VARLGALWSSARKGLVLIALFDDPTQREVQELAVETLGDASPSGVASIGSKAHGRAAAMSSLNGFLGMQA
jgi:hypothetical protein